MKKKLKPIKKLNCNLCPKCRIILDNLIKCQRCGQLLKSGNLK